MRANRDILDQEQAFKAWFIETFCAASSVDKSLFTKANFNPSEPRHEKARWTTTGDLSDRQAAVLNIQYRGRFHDAVVDELCTLLTGLHSEVLRGVLVTGVNGLSAILDLMVKPAGASPAYFIEVKTGDDPRFTGPQEDVYPLICLGGHATSADPRIQRMGLTPGAPLPSTDIILYVTKGPGETRYWDSYCAYFRFRGPARAP